ncbi:hypothetical protein FRACYDRAFT_240875 [Fragilariopsis cylindrus CCMP1102]|uniref:Uncharacterized protein n=1 Tax=Fragilariopsis cylindrus CCMP1102 TaxID=635003 RepID=A0A1E7F878_9STRA|nr:hypothetical protein FRACYDRAFT_240875 [Fragilariopsis cylindrus CCMP1102]|eukprot:OEU14339.1 hypothetical protein FRACYDRAFT_240875 [Fragilariopsis cylindrus CCMP1102]
MNFTIHQPRSIITTGCALLFLLSIILVGSAVPVVAEATSNVKDENQNGKLRRSSNSGVSRRLNKGNSSTRGYDKKSNDNIDELTFNSDVVEDDEEDRLLSNNNPAEVEENAGEVESIEDGEDIEDPPTDDAAVDDDANGDDGTTVTTPMTDTTPVNSGAGSLYFGPGNKRGGTRRRPYNKRYNRRNPVQYRPPVVIERDGYGIGNYERVGYLNGRPIVLVTTPTMPPIVPVPGEAVFITETGQVINADGEIIGQIDENGNFTAADTVSFPTGPTAPTTPRPTNDPTDPPSRRPSRPPTRRPTGSPTQRPTAGPSRSPTRRPTQTPTQRPTQRPTDSPTRRPSPSPTRSPTRSPTQHRLECGLKLV